jgi:hypothetical protein
VKHLLFCVLAFAAAGQTGPARGPLRVLKSNPRYFTDGSGKAIFLAGTHNWNNFQDTGHRAAAGDPPPVLNYQRFLDFLESHHHNFFRLWRWEAPMWHDDEPVGVKHASPHPWLRTGPGMAHDAKPRFDLTRFDPEYFDRMRRHIEMAQARGIYVSVMLFEGWEMQFVDAWTYHPFNPDNNVNQVDADTNHDGRALEYYTLAAGDMGKRVLEFQKAYVRKVIDTVNDLDNVLYEICNEAGSYSTPWQYQMIDFVHEYEAGKPRQHPVGMTFQYPGGTNRELFDSPADWISPNRGDSAAGYLENPPANVGDKVVVNDTDHLCGHTCGDNLWVWKSFTRGLNVLFMEELTPSPTWHDSARVAMGQTRVWAGKIDLAEMPPHDALSTTGYCLAKPGFEYLVLQPGGQGEFRVNLSDGKGFFAVEWFDINAGKTVPGQRVEGGSRRIFATPFPGPAVVYLKRMDAER